MLPSVHQATPQEHDIERRYSVPRLIALSLIATLLLLADDWIQQLFIPANQAELELRYVAVLWLFCIGLWLIGRPRVGTFLLAGLAVMQVIQLSHISYFGGPISAVDIGILRDNWRDVHEAGMASVGDHWHVIPAVLLPYGALALLLHLQQVQAGGHWHWLGWLLIVAILAAKPYRASYRGMDHFMPGPTRSSLHNSLNAFAYFGVNMAFSKNQNLPEITHPTYRLTSTAADTRHVWLVVADSLRTDRLSAYGYARKTTPGLDTLLQQERLIARKGIAAGVNTITSLSYLLNLVHRPGQPGLLREQPYNLFRLAKNQGFSTHWVSSQESRLLSYAGSRFIDASLTREDYPMQFLLRHDFAIVDLLKQQTWSERNFVVINLRTAHLPYEENYDRHDEPRELWPVHQDMPREQRFGNAYDNSLRYLNDVLMQIIQDFDRLEGERVLMITGDHGQLLGEGGHWGHNELVPEVVEVPVMVYAPQANPRAVADFTAERWVSHYEAGVWLAARFGVEVVNPSWNAGEHFNHGDQIFGDKYIQHIRETPAGLIYEKPTSLSRWLRKETAAPLKQ